MEASWGPTTEITLRNGDVITGRTVTHNVYDNEPDATGLVPGRPTTGVPDNGFGLVVEARASATDRTGPGAAGDLFDTARTRYRYDPIQTGDGDGWVLKTPTRTLVEDSDISGGWATTTVRFDDEGKVIETRTPQSNVSSGTAATARTMRTTYYTADASADRAECRNKPAWAAQTCWHGPAAQPGTGQPIPATRTWYSMWLSPTRTEETSGAATRASVTAYDDAGRMVTEGVSTSGLTSADRTVPTTTTTYSTTTGLATQVSNGIQTMTTGYDEWGRLVSQTDGAGNTATTSYDAAGRVASANDGKGTYSYSYNGTDALGKKERRGLVTSLDAGYASGSGDVFAGAYDESGALIKETMPGDVTTTWTRDLAGNPMALTYTKGSGTSATELAVFTATRDAAGRARTQSSPGSKQTFRYDDRDRLIRVQDTVDSAAHTSGSACTTRVSTAAEN